MSRSKRKSSSRQKRALPPEAPSLAKPAGNEGHSPAASQAGGADTAPIRLSLPEGPLPQAGQAGGVSRTVCVLSCLVCLLAGILLGNGLPQLLDTARRADPPREESAEQAQGPLPDGATARSESPSPESGRQNPAPAVPAPPASQEQHIARLEQALREQPDDAARWTELGNAYFDEKEHGKAIEAYGRSLALRPNNPNVLTDLGIMYRETGQYERALKCFDQAMRLEPAHEYARFNKGIVLLFDLHRHAEAKAVWQELLRLNPRAVAPDGTRLDELIRQCDKPLPPRQQ